MLAIRKYEGVCLLAKLTMVNRTGDFVLKVERLDGTSTSTAQTPNVYMVRSNTRIHHDIGAFITWCRYTALLTIRITAQIYAYSIYMVRVWPKLAV